MPEFTAEWSENNEHCFTYFSYYMAIGFERNWNMQ